MAISGVTHFNKVSGINGVFTGAAGSEVQIDVGTQVFDFNFSGASTGAEFAYVVLPYATKLVSAQAVISSGTTGTGATINITATDTAGAALFTAGTFTSAGTAGAQVITFAGASTALLAAASVICVAKASCATAYGATIVIAATKAS